MHYSGYMKLLEFSGKQEAESLAAALVAVSELLKDNGYNSADCQVLANKSGHILVVCGDADVEFKPKDNKGIQ